ncbi:MAG: acetyltransferase, partial [Burkholderiales bacterium]
DEAFRVLCGGYDSDLRRAAALLPAHASPHAALYALPQARWARRVSGVLANRLAREAPARAHAVLTPNSRGGFVVNVRAPMERPRGAAALCLAFATGGGREAAAGINHLEASEVERFTRQFFDHFELHS